MSLPDGQLEWLETNELGSFAFGNVDRKLRRKYHALLTVRDPGQPPGQRDAWNVLAEVREQLERSDEQALLVDPISGTGRHSELVSFQPYPHARHLYRALDAEIERCVRLNPRHDQVEIEYRVRVGRAPFQLTLEPLLRCRPLHELTQENPFLDGTVAPAPSDGARSAEPEGEELRMLPYAGMPPIALRVAGHPARFEVQGSWQHVAHYDWEAARGYSAHEALFSPGKFVLEIERDTRLRLLIALRHTLPATAHAEAPADLHFMAKLERAARQFFMRSPAVDTTRPPAVPTPTEASAPRRALIVAGYPWFGAWSRDALIALPGLYLATQDWERCAAVLETLAGARVHGLLPNIPAGAGAFVDSGAVDASLLFVRAVQWFAQQLGPQQVERFMPVVCQLLEALAEGADARMRFDHGVGVFTQPGGQALTWMDAMIDGNPVTPRAGYAVEVDALAYNAVHFACAWADVQRPAFARSFRARLRHAEGDFIARYWDDQRGYLADAHDGQHADGSLRPNQLWALALPYRPVSGAVARASLQVISRELFTPAGLRTLAPHDRAYRGRYAGTQPERDRAYHQGSVWPWLLGIYADAIRATHGHSALVARLGPALSKLARHLDAEGCVGQVSEIFDGDAPHAAAGAPAQAWSVAELYRTARLLHDVGDSVEPPDRGKTRPSPQLPSW